MSSRPRRHPGRYPSPVTDPSLRVSDAERDEVSERLSRHFADGRLDQAEFATRLGRATGAVTRGDLDGLFDDLPRLDDEPPPPRAHRRRVIPLVLLLVLVVMAVDSAWSLMHVPWLLLAVVGLLCWYRWGRHHAGSGTGR